MPSLIAGPAVAIKETVVGSSIEVSAVHCVSSRQHSSLTHQHIKECCPPHPLETTQWSVILHAIVSEKFMSGAVKANWVLVVQVRLDVEIHVERRIESVNGTDRRSCLVMLALLSSVPWQRDDFVL